MKTTILAENLNQALGIVSRSVAVRPQLPVLGNVMMKAGKDGVELLTTDLEISFRVKIGAKVEVEGEASLPAKIVTELVATITSGVVEISAEKETVKITSGKMKAQIGAMSAGEFPAIPVFKGTADLVFESDSLRRTIQRVAASASRDDSRPVFTGMLWLFAANAKQKVRLVATDGYRLAIDEIEANPPSAKASAKQEKELKKLIIPARSLQELVRVMDKSGETRVEVKVEEEKQQVIFKIGEIELVSRLLAGDFPPYQQILPTEYKTKVEFGREELTEAIKRASIFARESANIIKLTVSGQQSIVSANGAEVGSSETEVEVKVEGEDLAVAFNSRYLLDYLANVTADLIEFRSEGSLKPGVFVEQGKTKSGYLQVIMPVRVQE